MNPPDETLQLWDAYLASERIRIRPQSMEALESFISALLELEPEHWHPWARDLAMRVIDDQDQTDIRLPLFRSVLFPALHTGLHTSTPGTARWLAGFSQLLYKCPECSELLPENLRTEYGLLQRAVSDDGSDLRSKMRLLGRMRSHFEYALHELPSGILYGHDGATIEECGELLAELADYKRLADEVGLERDHELVSEAEFHITAYRKYLGELGRYTNYSQYLARRGSGEPID